MKARDVISHNLTMPAVPPEGKVMADMPLSEILPRLLDSPDRLLGVWDSGDFIGIIDESSMLEGLNKLIIPRDDSSIITIETAPSAFSASQIAHAVEDSDTHLVDFWSAPTDNGNIAVTLRVRSSDPSATVMNLERYGYDVTYAFGNEYRDAELAAERLLGLQALLNI